MNKVNWRYLELDGHPLPNRIVLAQDCKNKTAVVIMSKNKKYRYAFQCSCGKELVQKEVWRWVYLEEIE